MERQLTETVPLEFDDSEESLTKLFGKDGRFVVVANTGFQKYRSKTLKVAELAFMLWVGTAFMFLAPLGAGTLYLFDKDDADTRLILKYSFIAVPFQLSPILYLLIFGAANTFSHIAILTLLPEGDLPPGAAL